MKRYIRATDASYSEKTRQAIIQELERIKSNIWVREDIEDSYDQGYRSAELDIREMIDRRIAYIKGEQV